MEDTHALVPYVSVSISLLTALTVAYRLGRFTEKISKNEASITELMADVKRHNENAAMHTTGEWKTATDLKLDRMTTGISRIEGLLQGLQMGGGMKSEG